MKCAKLHAMVTHEVIGKSADSANAGMRQRTYRHQQGDESINRMIRWLGNGDGASTTDTASILTLPSKLCKSVNSLREVILLKYCLA